MDIQQQVENKILVIYSGDRDRNTYPNPNSFTVDSINFREFKNLLFLRIKKVILPIIAVNYPFLTLIITEVPQKINGSNQNINNSYCVLYPIRTESTQLFATFEAESVYSRLTSDLHRLSFQLNTPDGSPVNLGSDTSTGNPLVSSVQCTFILELVCNSVSNSNTSFFIHR